MGGGGGGSRGLPDSGHWGRQGVIRGEGQGPARRGAGESAGADQGKGRRGARRVERLPSAGSGSPAGPHQGHRDLRGPPPAPREERPHTLPEVPRWILVARGYAPRPSRLRRGRRLRPETV